MENSLKISEQQLSKALVFREGLQSDAYYVYIREENSTEKKLETSRSISLTPETHLFRCCTTSLNVIPNRYFNANSPSTISFDNPKLVQNSK